MSEPIIAVSSNSCKCINQTMTTRACPECHGLIYSMPVLVEEIERLTKENADLRGKMKWLGRNFWRYVAELEAIPDKEKNHE